MSKPISEEVRKKYVEESGGYCPHCKTSNINGGSMDYEHGAIYQKMLCNECGEDWVDAYHLTNVLE